MTQSPREPETLAEGTLISHLLELRTRLLRAVIAVAIAFIPLAYTGGIVFYRWRELPYNHALWHAAVLLGSGFHFFAILFYVMPRGVG